MFQRCYLQGTADESWECGTDLLKSGHSGYGNWFAAGADIGKVHWPAVNGQFRSMANDCIQEIVLHVLVTKKRT